MSETKSPGEGELPGPVDMDAQEYEARLAPIEGDTGPEEPGDPLFREFCEGHAAGCKETKATIAETLQRWIDWTRDGRELRRADLLKLRDELLS